MRNSVRSVSRRPVRQVIGALRRALVITATISVVAAQPAEAIPELQSSNGANTFLNPYNASGMGPRIAADTWVDVSCKVYAPQIRSANPDGYWYLIASAPWNNAYYAVANTFRNGDIPGQPPYIHNTDWAVPDCSAAPSQPPAVPPAPPVDADGDGFFAQQDCDEANPQIRPGALELPGNEVDENCDGKLESLPTINAGLSFTTERFSEDPRGSARIAALTATRLPADARVTVTCAAPRRPRWARRSCPFHRKAMGAPKRREVKLARPFKKRALAPRTVIVVTVTATATNGKTWTLRVTKRGVLKRTLACATPGGVPTPC